MRFYDCDEHGFPTNQTNGKCVTVKGERTFKLSFGASWENITVSAVVNAAGIALDPLILREKLNGIMVSENALPNTCCGKSAKGWIDSEAFAKQMVWKILQGCQGTTIVFHWAYTSNHIGNEKKCYSN